MCYTRIGVGYVMGRQISPNWGARLLMRVRCLVFDRRASMLLIDGVYLNLGFYCLVCVLS